MFSLTLRTMPEAKLPKPARLSCAHSHGRLPVGGWYLGPAAQAAASELGTSDCAISGRIDRQFQNPEALS